jgi:hypothetical protein
MSKTVLYGVKSIPTHHSCVCLDRRHRSVLPASFLNNVDRCHALTARAAGRAGAAEGVLFNLVWQQQQQQQQQQRQQ